MMIPPVVAPASAAAISILPSATPVMAGGTPMIAPINLPINLSDGSAPAPIGNTLAIVSGVAKELAAKEVVSTLLHQNGQIYNPHPRFYPPNVNKTLAVVAAHQTAASSSSSSAAAAASSPHGNGYEQHRRSGGGTAANGTGDADGGDIVGASGTITQSAALNAANQYKDENEKEPPKNDYSQHFVDTSQRPQNYIRDADVNDRFQEYPKLRELIMLKNDMIRRYATPPMYLNCDLKTFDLSQLGTKVCMCYRAVCFVDAFK